MNQLKNKNNHQMSSNSLAKNILSFPDFKYPLNPNLNTSFIEEISSPTPHKDFFLHIKPQITTNNISLNINNSNISRLLLSGIKSPNKYSNSFSNKKKEKEIFEPKLFINEYNSENKNNSEITQKSNYLLYFNSNKKVNKKTFIGKKRLFKYILSSEKKIKNLENKLNNKGKNINIKNISLHGYHLLNINYIQKYYEIKNILFPNTLIKLLTKKYKYFNIEESQQENIYLNKDDIKNIEKVILTKNELHENNIDYYENEISPEKIIKNYCNDMHSTLEKIKFNYIHKKKFIYLTNNILLLELLIRNCNLFTNYLIKKCSKSTILLNNTNNSNNIDINNNQINQKKFKLFSTNQSLPLFEKKFLENLPENHSTTSKKINLNISQDTNIVPQKKLFKAKIPLANTYKCDFCERIFKNGQALGGHISQSHPKQSDKYRQKIEIRKSRSDRRELLYEARRRLFRAYNIDLDYLIKNERKNEIKNFIKVHKIEYKKELFNLKNNSNIISNNIIHDNKNVTIGINNGLNTSSYENSKEINDDIDININ